MGLFSPSMVAGRTRYTERQKATSVPSSPSQESSGEPSSEERAAEQQRYQNLIDTAEEKGYQRIDTKDHVTLIKRDARTGDTIERQTIYMSDGRPYAAERLDYKRGYAERKTQRNISTGESQSYNTGQYRRARQQEKLIKAKQKGRSINYLVPEKKPIPTAFKGRTDVDLQVSRSGQIMLPKGRRLTRGQYAAIGQAQDELNRERSFQERNKSVLLAHNSRRKASQQKTYKDSGIYDMYAGVSRTSNRNYNSTSDTSNNLSVQKSQTFLSGAKDFIVEGAKSVYRGGKKQFSTEFKVLSGRNDTKIFSELDKDSDVLNFKLATATVAITPAFPKAPVILGGVVTAKEGYEFVKAPTSYQFGRTATAASLSFAPSIFRGVKRASIKIGSKYTAPETVFDATVLEGKQTFPTYKNNVFESIEAFRKAKTPFGEYVVTHTTNVKYPRMTDIKSGGASAAGLQDRGLYVTPEGRTSPHFLGIKKQTQYKFSLIPKKSTSPNVVRISNIKRVSMQPKKVIDAKGFESANKYLESQKGSRQAFITKRSTLGHTKEIEAVIPEGEGLVNNPTTVIGKLKGYDRYTEFRGELVPIREYSLTGKQVSTTSFNATATKLVRQAKSGSSLYRPRVVRVTPYRTSVLASSSKSSYSRASRSIIPASSASVSSGSTSSGTSYSTTPSVPGTPSYTSTPSYTKPTPSTPSYPRPTAPTSSTPSYPRLTNDPRYPSTMYKSPEKTVPTFPPNTLRSSPFPRGDKDRNQKFNVEVRRQGRFRVIATAKTLKKAYDIGTRSVRNTAAASLRITTRGRRTVTPLDLGRGFYKSKKELGVVIQKNTYRIGTQGEKFDITYKGIRASKKRKKVLL